MFARLAASLDYRFPPNTFAQVTRCGAGAGDILISIPEKILINKKTHPIIAPAQKPTVLIALAADSPQTGPESSVIQLRKFFVENF